MGASTESPSDNPGATEVLDHVPDDVSIVSSDKDNSTATVDEKRPLKLLRQTLDLEWELVQSQHRITQAQQKS